MRLHGAAETLENAALSIRIKDDGDIARLESLYAKASGTEFIDPRAEANNLFRIRVYAANGKYYDIRTSGSASCVMDKPTEDQLVLTWTGIPAGPYADAIDVSATIQLADSGSQWSIAVTPRRADVGINSVRFPYITNLGKIGDPEKTFMAIPFGTGRLFKNPFATMDASRTLRYGSSNCAMQCFAYYGENGGLYLATHDGSLQQKHYVYENRKGKNLAWGVEQYPETLDKLGAAYKQPYPVIIEPLAGDYFAAAKRYRSWALDQLWMKKGPLVTRSDMGGIRDVDLLVTGPTLYSDSKEKSVIFPMEFLCTAGELEGWDLGFDLSRVQQQFAALESQFHGYRIVYFNTFWHLDSFDVGYPRFIPRRNFREHNQLLNEMGLSVMPYTNLRRAVRDPRFEWWRLHAAEVEPEAIRRRDGKLMNAPLRGIETSVISPSGEFWRNFWINKTKDLVSHHQINGLYLDELAAMSPEPNYPAGADVGTSARDWIVGTRALCAALKSAGTKLNPDFYLCGEQVSETYLDSVDANLLYGQSKYFDSIPFFHAVYHDYTVLFGKTYGKWSDPWLEERYPKELRSGDKALDEFVVRFFTSTIIGEGIGAIRSDLASYSQEAWDLLRRMMQLRRNFGQYLKYGELLAFRDGGFPGAEPFVFPGLQWTTFEQANESSGVIYSVWRSAKDDSIAIIIANPSPENRTIRIPETFSTWYKKENTGGTLRHLEIDGKVVTESPGVSAATPLDASLELPARSFKIMTWQPDSPE